MRIILLCLSLILPGEVFSVPIEVKKDVPFTPPENGAFLSLAEAQKYANKYQLCLLDRDKFKQSLATQAPGLTMTHIYIGLGLLLVGAAGGISLAHFWK